MGVVGVVGLMELEGRVDVDVVAAEAGDGRGGVGMLMELGHA